LEDTFEVVEDTFEVVEERSPFVVVGGTQVGGAVEEEEKKQFDRLIVEPSNEQTSASLASYVRENVKPKRKEKKHVL
jgi:hypothetical protein